MKQTITIMILLCMLCGCSTTLHIRWGTSKAKKASVSVTEDGVEAMADDYGSTDPNLPDIGVALGKAVKEVVR